MRGMAMMKTVRDVVGTSALLAGVWCSPVHADEAQRPVNMLADASDARRIVDVVESLGVDLVRGPSSDMSSGVHAMVSTRESPMPLLLQVDCDRASITLLRAADGHLLSRKVARDTLADAPYAAAVIATEMVELMREEPLKRGGSGSPDAEDLRAGVAWSDDGFLSARGQSTATLRSVRADDSASDCGNSQSPSRLPARLQWLPSFHRRMHSTSARLSQSLV